VARLEYTFKSDTLFKILFVDHPDLLKRLVAQLLSIPLASIGEFVITNPEIPPEAVSEKFCRLDINMKVDDRLVDLEIQIGDDDDYRARTLYYWARIYSAALGEGKDYSSLPSVIIVSIVDFRLFECKEFHSEFKTLEVRRYEEFSDRMSLHFFELPKFPLKAVSADDELSLWMALFKAKTEEDLEKIEALEVPVMKKAIRAYHRVTATDRFKEIERLRSLARHNEASALKKKEREVDAKWQGIVEEKEAENAELATENAKLRALLKEKGVEP